MFFGRSKNKSTDVINKFKKQGVVISGNVFIEKNVTLHLSAPFFNISNGKINLDENAKLSQGVICHAYGGEVNIGKNVFIGPYVVIYGHGGVTIGDNSMIAMGCKIASNSHTIPSPDKLISQQPDIPAPIIIGKDVLLYADVVVLPGVTIGDGCVIGAGSVVTKSIPANCYAIGVPARVVKERK